MVRDMSHTAAVSMTWTREHTVWTFAAPEHVWACWSTPLRWPQWDVGIKQVTSVGPFERGSRGTIKPAKGPRTAFVLTTVEEGVGFTTMSPLPLATLALSHRLMRVDGGTQLTHAVTITGLAAPLFARLIGRRLVAGLPDAMRSLAGLAEAAERGA